MFHEESRDFMRAFDEEESRKRRADERFSLRKRSREECFQRKRRQMNMLTTISPDETDIKEGPNEHETQPSIVNIPVNALQIQNENLVQDLKALRNMTTKENVPTEVLDVLCGEHLVKLVELHSSFNAVPNEHRQNKDWQVLVSIAWILTNIASGEHRHTQRIITSGALDNIMESLRTIRDDDVCNQMLWAVANVLGDCDLDTFDKIVSDEHVVRRATRCVRKNLEPPMYGEKLNRLDEHVWMIGNFCSNARLTFADDANDDSLREIMHCVVKTIQDVQDSEVRMNAVYALSRLFDCATNEDSGKTFSSQDDELYIEKMLNFGADSVLHLLVEFCEPKHMVQRKVRLAALKALGNLAAENNSSPDLLFSYGLAEKLRDLLEDESPLIRKNSAWILSNFMLCGSDLIDWMFALEIFPAAMKLCKTDIDNSVRKEAGWIVVRACMECNYAQIEKIVSWGLFETLVPLFANVHTQKKFALEILAAIDRVLHTGSNLRADENVFREAAEQTMLFEVLEQIQGECDEDLYHEIEKVLSTYYYDPETQLAPINSGTSPSIGEGGEMFQFSSSLDTTPGSTAPEFHF